MSRFITPGVRGAWRLTRTLSRRIEVEDTAAAVLEFANGAVGVIQAATCVFPGAPRRLEISGDKGTIVLVEDQIARWDLEGQSSHGSPNESVSPMQTSSVPSAFGVEGHVRQMEDMVKAVRNNTRPLVDHHEGRKPVEIILAAYEASKTGRPVLLAGA